MSGLRSDSAQPLTVRARARMPRTREPIQTFDPANPKSRPANPKSRIPNPKSIAPDRETATGCGDASACLKLRTPLTRRDQLPIHQIACPARSREKPRKTCAVTVRRPVRETRADLASERFSGSHSRPPCRRRVFDAFPIDPTVQTTGYFPRKTGCFSSARAHRRAPLQRCRSAARSV